MTSWKLIEDVTLCEYWVHTTYDPITDNEMDKRECGVKLRKRFAMYMEKTLEVVKVFKVVGKKLNASFTC